MNVKQTREFTRWLTRLKDGLAKAVITRRVERLGDGAFGDTKSLGGGLFELRIDVGSGYRVYFINDGAQIVVLLLGGNKRTQRSDIKRARKIAEGIWNT